MARTIMGGVLSLLLTGLTFAAVAQQNQAVDLEKELDPNRLIAEVIQSQKAGDLERMQRAAYRLVQVRPHVGAYSYLLAKAYALAGKQSDAYNILLLLNTQGLSFDLSKDPDLENIRGYEVFDFIASGYAKNAEQSGDVIESRELDAPGLLADGLAWDPKRKQLLVGSITEGTVSLVGDDGELQVLVKPDENNGLLGVFDIAVDPRRRALWISTAAVPHYKHIRYQDIGRTSIVEVDLDSAQVTGRYDLPGVDPANKLVNLTVAPNGDVYAANSGIPEVYRIEVATRTMTRIFQAPSFTSLRGLAVSADGERLYFSDYELGLFGVTLSDNKAFQVTGSPSYNLGGIDSLSWFDNGLIAVQNGNYPNRVYRLVLDDSGQTVTSGGALLVNHPDMLAPSEGIVVDGQFHLLARNTSALYDGRSGKLREGVELPPQVLLSVATDLPKAPGPGLQLAK